MKLMRIQSWAVKTFDRPPCEKTLYRWAKEKLIWPPPRKQGKAWVVVPSAKKHDRDDPVLKDRWS